MGDKSSVLHQAMGLTLRVLSLFEWFDNLDLLIASPNGRQETHTMAHEFQQHPSGLLEKGDAQPGVMNIVIPRLLKTAARNLNTRSVPLQHYIGPNRVNCPIVPVTSGIPYTDLFKREKSQAASLLIYSSDNSMEWFGYNNKLTRDEVPGIVKPPATEYLFGPLIDKLPSHQDTVLTSMFYMTNSIAMHIVMSFLGCIGTLMKGSGLERYGFYLASLVQVTHTVLDTSYDIRWR